MAPRQLHSPRIPLLGLLALALLACREEPEGQLITPPKGPDGALQATSPDRLPPGELLEGTEKVFGFPIPRGMKLEAHFSDNAHITGDVELSLLTDYVRKHVLVEHVQVEGGSYIFPRARIRGGTQDIFRLEVRRQGTKAKISITYLPPPKPPDDASVPDQWKRAGMRPDGSLIDPQNLE